jgi:hypothetical protein
MMWKKIKTYVRHGIAALTGGVGGLVASVAGVDAEAAELFSQDPTAAIATAVAVFVYAMTEKALKNVDIFQED